MICSLKHLIKGAYKDVKVQRENTPMDKQTDRPACRAIESLACDYEEETRNLQVVPSATAT